MTGMPAGFMAMPQGMPAQPPGMQTMPMGGMMVPQWAMHGIPGIPAQGNVPSQQVGQNAPPTGDLALASLGVSSGMGTGDSFRLVAQSLSTREQQYYKYLWEQTGCEARNEAFGGRAAFQFLSKSSLSREVLKRIWDIADWNGRAQLGWQEFVVTMKLISAAQKRQPFSLERVLDSCSPKSLDCPEFEGLKKMSDFQAAVQTGERRPSNEGLSADSVLDTSAVSQPVAQHPQMATVPVTSAFNDLLETGEDTGSVPQPLEVQATATMTPDPLDMFPSSAQNPPLSPSPVQFGTSIAENDLFATSAPVPQPSERLSSLRVETDLFPTSMPVTESSAKFSASAENDLFATPAKVPQIPARSETIASINAPAWDAFDDTGWGSDSGAAPVPATEVAPLVPQEALPSADFDAFGFDEPAASVDKKATSASDAPAAATLTADAEEWAEFTPAPQGPATGGVTESSWADFAGADAAGPEVATAVPAAAASQGQGTNLWAKMSAFDSLLSEDDVLGGAIEAVQLQDAFRVEALSGPPPAPVEPPSDFDLMGMAFHPVEEAATVDAAADDDWGDFAAGDVNAAAVDKIPAKSDGSDDDTFGLFPEVAPAEVRRDGIAAAAAALSSVAPVNGIAAAAAALTAASQQPLVTEEEDWPASFEWTAPPPAAVSTDTNAKEDTSNLNVEDGCDRSVEPEAAGDAVAEVADTTDATPAWGFDFEAEEGEAPNVVASGDAGHASSEEISASVPAWPQSSLRVPSLFDEDADFFNSTESTAAPQPVTEVTTSPPAAPIGFDADFDGFPAPEVPVQPSMPTMEPVSKAEEVSWSAFDDDDMWPAPPPAVAAPLATEAAVGPLLAPTVPPVAVLPMQEASSGFEQLALALAALGLYDKAESCQNHAAAEQRLADAEERKKAAIAREDFEGAISFRSEIQNLSTILAQGEVDSWRQLAATGQYDRRLDDVAECLQQRSKRMDDQASRAALHIAIANFREACPSREKPDLERLPQMALSWRSAWHMSRAIETSCSSNMFRFIQVLCVCLGALANILQTCVGSLSQLSDMTEDERHFVLDAKEFQSFVEGLGSLRQLWWRLGQSSELFLPRRGSAGADSAELAALHSGARMYLDEIRKAWSEVERMLSGVPLELDQRNFGDSFEGGGSDAALTAPLCPLCLQPTAPQDAEISESSVASALWRGSRWHVQCVHFWAQDASTSALMTHFGLADPFVEQS